MRNYVNYTADFETTVYSGQDRTDVWAMCLTNIETKKSKVYGNIEYGFSDIFKMRKNVRIFYHNLAFDGTFILQYLLKHKKLRAGYQPLSENKFKKPWDLKHGEYSYLITADGLWYNISIAWRGCLIQILDSMKLLPMSVKDIGESFQTSTRKSSIEYEGVRYPNCHRTKEEDEYIISDTMIPAEALEELWGEGHDKITISSCAMAYFKFLFEGDHQIPFNDMFPNLYAIEMDETTIGDWIRESYKGAWCYVNKNYRGKIIRKGYTLDVNSLYSTIMHSSSGNYYPVGNPTYFKGHIPEYAYAEDKYFFVKIKTAFNIKEGKLPFIQIKGTLDYRGSEMLETSDIILKDGRRKTHDKDGSRHTVELTLTHTDYQLFLEHYETDVLEIIECMVFNAEIGLFDEYIDHFMSIKMNSKGGKRAIAKLFLNGLYGKFATSPDSSYKIARLEDEILMYETIHEADPDKEVGYIPIGSAITSYARDFTIRHAQENYERFIYADTDSNHLEGDFSESVGYQIHSSKLGCWKLELEWDEGIFIRQKGYIERKGLNLNVACSGMKDRCKEQIQLGWLYANGFLSVKELEKLMDGEKYNETQKAFVRNGFKLSDFKPGLKIFGNLKKKNIKGGVVLNEDYFNLRLIHFGR